MVDLGRKPLPLGEKKVHITITLKQKYIDRLRLQGVPSNIIEKLVENHLKTEFDK